MVIPDDADDRLHELGRDDDALIAGVDLDATIAIEDRARRDDARPHPESPEEALYFD